MSNILAISFVNVDTSEILFHKVDDFNLELDRTDKSLHCLLDKFIELVKRSDTFKSDTFSLEFRSYRSHKQLELPF